MPFMHRQDLIQTPVVGNRPLPFVLAGKGQTGPDAANRSFSPLHYETEHRILNSLQLVVSLLRDSIRCTMSDEARQEIHVAHQRILSVISLQKALFRTGQRVMLAQHFDHIARNLEASLIAKNRRVGIRVTCEALTVDVATATSLGLVVTELVINALKHAFPNGAEGTISVAFGTDASGWTLAVSDDGVGPGGGPRGGGPRSGQGTAILAALAAQLEATLVTDHPPRGYRVALTGRNALHRAP
jgi:two-component sensor histidine kinase